MGCESSALLKSLEEREPRKRIRALPAFVAAAALLASAACGRRHHHTAHVPSAPAPSRTARSNQPAPAVPLGYTEEGIASWYGVPYHGRPAADGEIYDMETLVAAHRVLPFNTWVKVTNVANDKSVTVRVIDRGPFVRGRILDLSKAAARNIDLLGPGVGKVRLEVVGAPPDIPSNDFYAVQVGAFSVQANAERERVRLAQRFGTAQLALKQGRVPMWRVLVGRQQSVEGAQALARTLAGEDKSVFVVRLDQSAANSVEALKPLTHPATSDSPDAGTSPSADAGAEQPDTAPQR